MVAMPNRQFVTPEDYLEHERDAEAKSEYDDGVIVAMSGASVAHATITANLLVAVNTSPELRRSGCRGYSSDLRVYVPAENRYYYPDLIALCGAPVIQEAVPGMEAVTNPSIIVEVLSDTTERQDRGRKWLAYKTIDTLRSYVLVHQDVARVEVFTRGPDGKWEYEDFADLAGHLLLRTHNASISMGAIYRDVAMDGAYPTGE